MTKNSPVKATDVHISIVGHATGDELRRYLSSTEAASGFGNRFLWVAVRRSKCLPDGGGAIDMAPITKRFSEAVSFARAIEMMPRDDEARELWHGVYSQLSGDCPGLAGSLLARAEAQTMRLACLYALLDGSYQVKGCHLDAALALWDFCERSTRFIFGNSTGDPVADEMLEALRHRPGGMTRTEIRDLFGRNKSAERIARASKRASHCVLGEGSTVEDRGEARGVVAIGQASYDKDDINDQRGLLSFLSFLSYTPWTYFCVENLRPRSPLQSHRARDQRQVRHKRRMMYMLNPKGLTMTETISSRLLLKPKEAADALRISERTLWQLTKDKEIPCVQIGGRIRQVVRYDPRNLQAWIDMKKQMSVSGSFTDQPACPVGKRP